MKLDAEAQSNAMYTVQHFFFFFFASTGCGGSNLQKNVVYLGPHFFLASACHRSPDGPLAACS